MATRIVHAAHGTIVVAWPEVHPARGDWNGVESINAAAEHIANDRAAIIQGCEPPTFPAEHLDALQAAVEVAVGLARLNPCCMWWC